MVSGGYKLTEIKFKTWDKGNQKWSMTPLKYAVEDMNHYTDYEWVQFSGLTDKHGNEIYTKDLIRTKNSIGFVEFKNGCFYVEWVKGMYYENYLYQVAEKCEVVGNKFEGQLIE